MSTLEFTLVGGPTVVFTYAGLTVMTDPTFDAPGTYGNLTKTAGPAVDRHNIGPVDLVLLSHDEHEDNLDVAGRALLASAATVVSTTAAAGRIPGVIGMRPDEQVTIAGTAPVSVTAVRALHGPPGIADALGPVTGFVLEASGWPTVYFSGDNSEVAVVQDIARRFPRVGIALICAGAARVDRLGDALLTADASTVIAIAELWPTATVLPIHIDDWAHFSQPRASLAAALAWVSSSPHASTSPQDSAPTQPTTNPTPTNPTTPGERGAEPTRGIVLMDKGVALRLPVAPLATGTPPGRG